MPEGDTILHAVRRMRPVLEGRVPDEIATLRVYDRGQGDDNRTAFWCPGCQR